jgi:hypothetical protein
MDTIRAIANMLDWIALAAAALIASLGMLVSGCADNVAATVMWSLVTLVMLRVIFAKIAIADLRDRCEMLRGELARLRAGRGGDDGR